MEVELLTNRSSRPCSLVDSNVVQPRQGNRMVTRRSFLPHRKHTPQFTFMQLHYSRGYTKTSNTVSTVARPISISSTLFSLDPQVWLQAMIEHFQVLRA